MYFYMHTNKAILFSAAWLLSGNSFIALAQEEPTGRPYYGHYNWSECQAVFGFVAGKYCYLPNSLAYFTMSWIPGINDYPNPDKLDPNAILPDYIDEIPCSEVPSRRRDNSVAQAANVDFEEGPDSVAPYVIDDKVAADLGAESDYLDIKQMKCDGVKEVTSPNLPDVPNVGSDFVGPPAPPPGPPLPMRELIKREAIKAAHSEQLDPGEKPGQEPYRSCSDSMNFLARNLGYYLPDISANEQVKWMSENWNEVKTMKEAKELADLGGFVIAGRSANINGHVTAIVTGQGDTRTENGQQVTYPNVAGGALHKKKNADDELEEIIGEAWSKGGRTLRDAWALPKHPQIRYFTPPPRP